MLSEFSNDLVFVFGKNRRNVTHVSQYSEEDNGISAGARGATMFLSLKNEIRATS
jgi:hypothetical protein